MAGNYIPPSKNPVCYEKHTRARSLSLSHTHTDYFVALVTTQMLVYDSDPVKNDDTDREYRMH